MVRKILILCIFVVSILMTMGCQKTAETKSDDFSLYYYWNTGALPPGYYYQIEVEITPNRSGILTYQGGYAADTDNIATFEFNVDEETWNNFYTWLSEKDIFRNDWTESEDILLGGSTTQVKLQSDGEIYVIPSESVLTKDEREVYYELEEQINQLVPSMVWDGVAKLKP